MPVSMVSPSVSGQARWASAPAHAPLPRHAQRVSRPVRGASLRAHNRQAEEQLGHIEEERGAEASLGSAVAASAAISSGSSGYTFDVLGLGQAMVDFSSVVNDDFLDTLRVEKGERKLITLEERASILECLSGEHYAVSAGGSLSNTLMALSRLSVAAAAEAPARGAPAAARPLRVGMAGLVGGDPLGEFYGAQMRTAGVEVVGQPLVGAHTGTVVVLTSPDAQRTMLSYLGTPAEVGVGPGLRAAIARSRVLVIEGYLWELPNAAHTIGQAIAVAQSAGCVVAMTAGDSGVVHRHHAGMWAAIDAGVDLLFTNAGEAAALARYQPQDAAATDAGALPAPEGCPRSEAERAALRLGPHCSVVAVTDGSAGSYITALGQLHVVPPCWLETTPVDTCGAGDAYAAGLLYGFLRHFDVASMGRTAARVASAVIGKHGAALTPDAAAQLAEGLPLAADRGWMAGVAACATPLPPKAARRLSSQ